jgi:hypothetical protein
MRTVKSRQFSSQMRRTLLPPRPKILQNNSKPAAQTKKINRENLAALRPPNFDESGRKQAEKIIFENHGFLLVILHF